MKVKNIEFANTDKSSVIVSMEDGTTIFASYPCYTGYKYAIKEWLDQGNKIKTPTKTIAELKQEKIAEINDAFSADVSAGVSYTFPDGSTDVIQTRPVDQTNLTTLSVRATQLKQDGDTTTTMDFRAQSNTTYALTSQEMIDVTNFALGFVSDLYKKAWGLKDQVNSATDASELDSINW